MNAGLATVLAAFGVDHWDVRRVCSHDGETHMDGPMLVCGGCQQVIF